MKKFIPLLFITIALVYSCTKNSSAPPTVAGKWFISTDSLYEFGSLYSDTSYNGQYYYQFNNDGTGLAYLAQNSATLSFTYTVAGNSIYFKFPLLVTGSITHGAQSDTATIKKLTPGSLSIAVKRYYIVPGGVISDTEDLNFNK